MELYDIEDEQVRERTRAAVAFSVRSHAESLRLKATPKTIELLSEGDRNLYLHRRINGAFNRGEQLTILRDVISGVGREGYVPSEVSKFAMSLGYVPTLIMFRRQV
jgi:hypothetical protein